MFWSLRPTLNPAGHVAARIGPCPEPRHVALRSGHQPAATADAAGLRDRPDEPAARVAAAEPVGAGAPRTGDRPRAQQLHAAIITDCDCASISATACSPGRRYGIGSSLPAKDRNMARVLVIEDDRRTAAEIASALGDYGFDVECAYNGRDGLLRASAEKYDAIVLDRLLPGDLDGLGVLATLRTIGNETP